MKNYAGVAKRIFSNGRDFDEEKLKQLYIKIYYINNILNFY